MRKLFLVALCTSVLVACAAKTGTGNGSSGIRGTVTIGPTCPVERADSPCPPTPYAAKITVSKAGDVVATATTAADGRFQISLEPGTYTIDAVPVNADGIARMQPMRPVTVTAGAFTGVTISFDSGIR